MTTPDPWSPHPFSPDPSDLYCKTCFLPATNARHQQDPAGEVMREVVKELSRSMSQGEPRTATDLAADVVRRLNTAYALEDVEGCSCGMADKGAPGHDQHA